jgi:hypothetical protein
MAQKFLTQVGAYFKEVLAATVGGSSTYSGQIPSLDANGRLDASFMPSGIGADTLSATASEAISAGAFVNLYNNAGALAVRNADNSAANGGKAAHGFVLAAIASGASGTVTLTGQNTAITGATIGEQYLGLAGAATSTPPVTSGSCVQSIGFANAATDMEFKPRLPIVLA